LLARDLPVKFVETAAKRQVNALSSQAFVQPARDGGLVLVKHGGEILCSSAVPA
jgi:hypothetical protein